MNVSVTGSATGVPDSGAATGAFESELRQLFHQLNNQLGIILAHAELLEVKAADDVNRARAGQVVASALEAMGTAKAIRQKTDPAAV